MSNIYDIYRGVQTKRNECYDERSAAFIEQGKLSKEVFHIRLNKDIKAALVFKHQEGPDEVLIYSYLKDDLQKADYFRYNNGDYLVYEENKITDDGINYKKQKAVECNVAFQFGNLTYKGYYKSSLRGSEDKDFTGRQIVLPDETPLLILPTNSNIKINSEFVIDGKPFKIMELDDITNKGITYYYLERGYNKTLPTKVEEPAETPNVLSAPEEEIETLIASREYTFTTENAYFETSVSVEIISKKRKEVVFKIPFGISSITISIMLNGEVISTNYKVVL